MTMRQPSRNLPGTLERPVVVRIICREGATGLSEAGRISVSSAGNSSVALSVRAKVRLHWRSTR